MSEQTAIRVLPVLPLKNALLFPNLLMPLSVGRPSSLAAVEAALATEEKEIILVAQKDPSVEAPTSEDLYTVGTKAIIRKVSRNDSVSEVLVVGVERMIILKLEQDGYLRARVSPFPLPEDGGAEVEALTGAVLELAFKAIELANVQAPAELRAFFTANNNTDPLRMVYLLASILSLDIAKEQALLEAASRVDALRLMHSYLTHEVQVLELRSKISKNAREEMSKEQRDYMLRQQMRAIQQELGDKNSEQAELDELKEKVAKADLPEDVRKEVERELGRLEKIPSASPEHHVLRTWIELTLELPWKLSTDDNLEISNARKVLDEDHYSLKDAKDRILEHLGVLKMNPNAKAPILCFVGPPGVGKTSLGQSIARALGRNFERMSLGGMHDEAELRGHRRTYIGAMPGRLIQAFRRAKSNNPVLLLDEVDKLGRDYRGDPAAALLEVLDPAQNKTFRDNYLDMPFDLSRTLFITTANSLDTIPRPLLDRMEIIQLRGYSEEEKIQIARRYLIPRQLTETGLNDQQVTLPEETLHNLIRGYTREAGLRRLERAIGKLTRKIALRFAEGNTEPVTIRPEDLIEYLGPEMFSPEEMRKDMGPGVATGLAWTETGGEVLYIEAALLPDGKGLQITGQLGEVMQESAKIAQSYVWSHAPELGIDPSLFKNNSVHVHVPAGAIPKDGPSAGITMTVALASLYAGVPARNDTAMTGEMTLSGLVLPIGGIKEKVLAARRTGIKRIVMPKANVKDLRDLPDEVRKEMEFIPVDRIHQVLTALLPGLSDRLKLAA